MPRSHQWGLPTATTRCAGCLTEWRGEVGRGGCPACQGPDDPGFETVSFTNQPLFDWLVNAGVAFLPSHAAVEAAWMYVRPAVRAAADAFNVWLIQQSDRAGMKIHPARRRRRRHSKLRLHRQRLYAVLRGLHGLEPLSDAARQDLRLWTALALEDQIHGGPRKAETYSNPNIAIDWGFDGSITVTPVRGRP